MSAAELPMTASPEGHSHAPDAKTEIGSYFISNYPPFSFWKPERLPEAEKALHSPPPDPAVPLGLYLHIPFCRKRCKFCYFRIYTDKNAAQIETYVDALVREIALYGKLPVIGGRPLRFVYFGGGTPSYLSVQQLESLVARLNEHISWKNAEEVTFECEPGTLQRHKLEALRRIGVTRLSLGIENFNDAILEENGRAHLSGEVFKAYAWAREIGFPQVNIDLIAGMVGETWENWKECLRKTIDLSPDSVTIYQMELPFNTVYSKAVRQDGAPIPVADWNTKRAWVDFAFQELAQAGYHVSSGYTLVKDKSRGKFLYRDALWHGSDLIGSGVASFSHVSGVHYQNVDEFDRYVELCRDGKLPLNRALTPTRRQRMIREMILQMKTGVLEPAYFRAKFGADVSTEFAGVFGRFQDEGLLKLSGDRIDLTRAGLLQVDHMLSEFFEPEHRNARYT
jgi:oxygen-independent coproporphyrinogen-3 oxidase